MNVKAIAFACCPPFLRPVLVRIENSPLGYRFVKGLFWSIAGVMASRGLLFLATVVVARLLGKTVYGELGILRSTFGMFGVFAGFGLSLTAIKHVAEYRDHNPDRAGRIIALSAAFAVVSGGIMSICLFVFAPWLAENTINAPHLAGMLRVGSLILFLTALTGAQTGALSGFEAFKVIAHVNLFVGLTSFPLLIAGAYYGGLPGTVWAMAINLGVNWILNHLALRKEVHRYGISSSFHSCFQEMGVLWSFSLPAFLASVLVSPVKWACDALLVNLPDEGFSQMGILAATLAFQQLLLFASNTMNTPLLSMLSNVGLTKSEKLETTNIIASWLLGLIPAIPLLCFPEVAVLLFGPEYGTRAFHITLSLVVFCTCILTFKGGLARVLIANNLLWWGFGSNVLWGIILIVSTYYLVPYGAPGLAAASVIAYILNTLVLLPLYYSRNLVPKGTLVSPEAGLIWAVLLGLVFLNLFDASLLLRALLFIPSFFAIGIALKKITFRNSPASDKLAMD